MISKDFLKIFFLDVTLIAKKAKNGNNSSNYKNKYCKTIILI